MVGQGSSPRGLLVAIVPVFVGLAFVLRPCGSRAVPNIDVEAVLRQGYRLTTRSWEYGALTEALLELYNPELTVFAETPFPKNEIPKPLLDYVPALQYVKSFISTDAESLINGEGGSDNYAKQCNALARYAGHLTISQAHPRILPRWAFLLC